MRSWKDVESRRALLAMSRAEMARRAGISESTIYYGLKRQTRPLPSILRQLETVLATEEQAQGERA